MLIFQNVKYVLVFFYIVLFWPAIFYFIKEIILLYCNLSDEMLPSPGIKHYKQKVWFLNFTDTQYKVAVDQKSNFSKTF